MDTATLLFLAIFFIFGMGAIVVVAVIGFFLVRSRLNSTKVAVRQLEEGLGLENRNQQGAFPDFHGEWNGVPVAVDVVYKQYARMGTSVRSSLRAWTRVRALLPEAPSFQLRSRHQRLDEDWEWPARPTGDAAFDQKYELFAPGDLPLEEVLPASLKDALMTANPPVHVFKGAVCWMQVKVVSDVALVKRALDACQQVAVACAKAPATR